MSIHLAPEYEQAYQEAKLYFSYTFDYEQDLSLAVLLRSFPEENTRFFWQTPDRQHLLVGFGQRTKLFPDDGVTMNDQKKRLHQQTMDPDNRLCLFGAFPFDVQANAAPLWNQLAEGGFLLPKVLFTFNQGRWQVTLTVKRPATFAALTTRFQKEQHRIILALSQAAPKVQKNRLVTSQEIAVKEWMETVDQAVKTIRNPNNTLKKIVLARQLALEMNESIDQVVLLQRLETQQPQTYLFYLQEGNSTFIGATPEKLLAATTKELTTVAVAGSIQRGKTPSEDTRLGQELLHSAKNLQEHQIVVERLQKNLQPFSQSTVNVSQRTLLKNRDIQHLYAELIGTRADDGASLFEMIQQLHPTPALGGEPKQAAIEWIRTHEPVGRGLYGAPIGWVSLAEDAGEFAVGIRSAVISGKHALLYAGCGIVADSNAEEERQETKMKFQPMKRGIQDEDTTTDDD